MRIDERIMLFKETAAKYKQYQEHIKGLDNKLVVVQSKMENVHSIDFEKSAGQSSFAEKPLIELIERKTELEKEKQYYEDLITWVDDIIASMDSGAMKALIWMSCVQRRSLASIADEYSFSRDTLYKVRKACLAKALSDERIQELDHLQEKASV